MLHTCVERFDVTDTVWKILVTKRSWRQQALMASTVWQCSGYTTAYSDEPCGFIFHVPADWERNSYKWWCYLLKVGLGESRRKRSTTLERVYLCRGAPVVSVCLETNPAAWDPPKSWWLVKCRVATGIGVTIIYQIFRSNQVSSSSPITAQRSAMTCFGLLHSSVFLLQSV